MELARSFRPCRIAVNRESVFVMETFVKSARLQKYILGDEQAVADAIIKRVVKAAVALAAKTPLFKGIEYFKPSDQRVCHKAAATKTDLLGSLSRLERFPYTIRTAETPGTDRSQVISNPSDGFRLRAGIGVINAISVFSPIKPFRLIA